MTDVRQFGADYINKVKILIEALEDMRIMQERVTGDPTLFARYIAAPAPRTDLVQADFDGASSAIVQLLFSFDSGSPTQKSALFKLL